MGSDFVPSFLVEKECTIKAGLLACLMIADVKKNRDATDLAALQPYTADVNHNVLQKNTLAEIVNNSIGNIAGVKGLPDSSLNNDKLYILMGNIYTQNTHLGKKFRSKSAMLPVSTLGGSKQQRHQFMQLQLFSPDHQETNIFEQWFANNEQHFLLDITKSEDHAKVAKQMFGLDYSPNTESGDRPHQRLFKFLGSIHKRKGKGSKNILVPGCCAVEGNHRCGNVLHELCGAEYNEGTGLVVPGSITREYLASTMALKHNKSQDEVMEMLEKSAEPLALIDDLIESTEASILNQEVRVTFLYGVKEAEFSGLKYDASRVTEEIKNMSRVISKNKVGSVVRPETREIADGIGRFKRYLMEANFHNNHPPVVSWRPTTRTTIHNYAPKNNKDRPLPPTPMNWSETTKAMVDPSEDNLRHFMDKFKNKQKKASSGGADVYESHSTPNYITWLNMTKDCGTFKREKKDKTTGEVTQYAEAPMDPAEANAYISFMLVYQPICRMWRGITRDDWDKQTEAEKSNHMRQLELLLLTQNWTSRADAVGATIAPEFVDEFGIESSTLIIEKHAHLAATCMVKDMINASVSLGYGNVKVLGELYNLFANQHEEMNGYREKELVWLLAKLYTHVNKLANFQRDAMRNAAYYSLRQNNDRTPKGFLTWCIYNGQVLNLLDGVLQFGFFPAFNLSQELGGKFTQLTTLFTGAMDQKPPSTTEREACSAVHSELLKMTILKMASSSKGSDKPIDHKDRFKNMLTEIHCINRAPSHGCRPLLLDLFYLCYLPHCIQLWQYDEDDYEHSMIERRYIGSAAGGSAQIRKLPMDLTRFGSKVQLTDFRIVSNRLYLTRVDELLALITNGKHRHTLQKSARDDVKDEWESFVAKMDGRTQGKDNWTFDTLYDARYVEKCGKDTSATPSSAEKNRARRDVERQLSRINEVGEELIRAHLGDNTDPGLPAFFREVFQPAIKSVSEILNAGKSAETPADDDEHAQNDQEGGAGNDNECDDYLTRLNLRPEDFTPAGKNLFSKYGPGMYTPATPTTSEAVIRTERESLDKFLTDNFTCHPRPVDPTVQDTGSIDYNIPDNKEVELIRRIVNGTANLSDNENEVELGKKWECLNLSWEMKNIYPEDGNELPYVRFTRPCAKRQLDYGTDSEVSEEEEDGEEGNNAGQSNASGEIETLTGNVNDKRNNAGQSNASGENETLTGNVNDKSTKTANETQRDLDSGENKRREEGKDEDSAMDVIDAQELKQTRDDNKETQHEESTENVGAEGGENTQEQGQKGSKKRKASPVKKSAAQPSTGKKKRRRT